MARARRYKVAVADTDAVHDFAENLPDEFLQCRELGHLWRPFSASVQDGYYERVLRCPRCRTRREEQISMSGEVLRRRMVYATGYLAHDSEGHGIGRIVGDGRGQLRLASITRTVAHTDELSKRRNKKAAAANGRSRRHA